MLVAIQLSGEAEFSTMWRDPLDPNHSNHLVWLARQYHYPRAPGMRPFHVAQNPSAWRRVALRMSDEGTAASLNSEPREF